MCLDFFDQDTGVLRPDAMFKVYFVFYMAEQVSHKAWLLT
jgi:hypothetical protein